MASLPGWGTQASFATSSFSLCADSAQGCPLPQMSSSVMLWAKGF